MHLSRKVVFLTITTSVLIILGAVIILQKEDHFNLFAKRSTVDVSMEGHVWPTQGPLPTVTPVFSPTPIVAVPINFTVQEEQEDVSIYYSSNMLAVLSAKTQLECTTQIEKQLLFSFEDEFPDLYTFILNADAAVSSPIQHNQKVMVCRTPLNQYIVISSYIGGAAALSSEFHFYFMNQYGATTATHTIYNNDIKRKTGTGIPYLSCNQLLLHENSLYITCGGGDGVYGAFYMTDKLNVVTGEVLREQVCDYKEQEDLRDMLFVCES